MQSVCITIFIDNIQWNPPAVLPPPMTYLMGQLELSAEGNQHWQLYGESEKPMNLKKWKTLLGANHAHIQSRRGTQEDAIKYCQKLESRLHGPGTTVDCGKPRDGLKKRKLQECSPYKKALEAENYETALKILREHTPRDYVIFNNQITSTLRKEFQFKWVPTKGLKFNIPDIEKDILVSKAVVLTGKTGIGKTQFALSQFENPLVCRLVTFRLGSAVTSFSFFILHCSHIDDLKRLVPSVDGIVFDDMNFGHWPANSCIHLVDLELPRSINVKYGTCTLPSRLPRIFTTNRFVEELFSGNATEEERAAIVRRIYILDYQTSLFE